MITINSSIVHKHDFTANYNGTTVANGSVEFTCASEQDAAKAAIVKQVAQQYGCDESKVRVYFWKYTGWYDNK